MSDAWQPESPEKVDIFYLGSPLPPAMSEALASTGSGGMVNLPRQILVASLDDYRESDADTFSGPVRFRVGLARNFIVLSLVMGSLNFDVIWSPVIARKIGEPNFPRPSGSDHPLFTFILVDGAQIIRSIRQSTISPECAMAIWRAQKDILGRQVTEVDLENEMIALFRQYPESISESFFHAICDLGD